MNKLISKKTVTPFSWVKVKGEDQVRLVKRQRVIPDGQLNSTYAFCNIVILAIKKAKSLKGSIEKEIAFIDNFSEKALKLSKVADILGLYMLKLAKVGYSISRDLEEYKDKSINDFFDIYRKDTRDSRAFKRKSLDTILREFVTLQDILATQDDRVQLKVGEDFKMINHEMDKGFILLHSIETNAIQSNR